MLTLKQLPVENAIKLLTCHGMNHFLVVPQSNINLNRILLYNVKRVKTPLKMTFFNLYKRTFVGH